MARSGGVVGRLQEAVEERTGLRLESAERVDRLEEAAADGRLARRELHDLAYTVLDHSGGNPQEMKVGERRRWAQKSRVAWMTDPQAGSAVELLNDFTFGRGVPKPRAKDPKVQEVLDEAWDDPDNQLVLTSYEAQLALGVDLQLQSNLFILEFSDGEDGRVKLAIADHDAMEDVVRDSSNRKRVLYYKARESVYEWDWKMDAPKVSVKPSERRVIYYEHWRNVKLLRDETEELAAPDGESAPNPTFAPEEKLRPGRVYHIAVNRTTEQVFGVPTMQRTLRWFSAYNDFMAARVDQTKAAAAFVMKRKVKGTKTQVQRQAEQALSKLGRMGAAPATTADGATLRGTQPGAILVENEGVEHEDFSLNTNAGNALTDGQMIRSQISAATHFPQHYLGDAGSANLATATSMELPVLKHVEGRQEVFEQLFRWFLDRVIERAKETGRLTEELDDEEYEALLERKGKEEGKPDEEEAAPAPGPYGEEAPGPAPGPQDFELAAGGGAQEPADLRDEEEKLRKRDFSYEFGLPSPLRRMMSDLIGAVMNIAKTFDPNGTNMELSRVLLAVALGEGLEVEDPASVVEAVFPPGYQDPAVQAFQAQQAAAAQPPGGQSPSPFELPPGDAETTYGAPGSAQTPEATGVMEARFSDLPVELQEMHDDDLLVDFDQIVGGAAGRALRELPQVTVNGNGNGRH